jgi:hypothetical protein
VVQNQPRQIIHEILSWTYHSHKRAGGVAQGVSPEFKPQYSKKERKNYQMPKICYPVPQ